MTIYTSVVLDWEGNVLDADAYEYHGPVAECGGLFGGAKASTPAPPPPPPAPPKPLLAKDVTEAVTTARSDQKKKARAAMGQQATLITGGQGLDAPATTDKKALLGQ